MMMIIKMIMVMVMVIIIIMVMEDDGSEDGNERCQTLIRPNRRDEG